MKALQESTRAGASQDRSCKTQPVISRATAEEAIHEEGAVAVAMNQSQNHREILADVLY